MRFLLLVFFFNPLRIAFGIYPKLSASWFMVAFSMLYFTTSLFLINKFTETNLYNVPVATILLCLLRFKITPLLLIASSVHFFIGAICNFDASALILAVGTMYLIRDANET